MDIVEDAGCLVVSVELPGVSRDKLHVAVSHNLIVVEGVKENVVTTQRVTYHCMERYFGRFRRGIEIPRPVNVRDAEACYTRGLLIITMPLIVERRGRWTTLTVS